MTTIELSSFNVYLGIALNALFAGLGTGIGIALGSYLSNKHILNLPKRIKKMLKRKK
jgi:predicted choloylglycine hydrolase